MNILLVDDDPDVLGLVTQFLTLSTRHEVVPTASAQEALAAISKTRVPFDCILSDIRMPPVDGIALVRMIRETPGYAYTPILMLSGVEEQSQLERAFFAGATDYLVKPIEFEALHRRLAQVQKQAADKKRAVAAVPGEGDFKGMGGEPKGFTLATPVPLNDVAESIDDAEFENFVRQMLRRQLFRASAFAVKIDRVERLYAAATTEEFTTLLSDIGTTIGAHLLVEGGALCYRGNGIFLCVTERRVKGRRVAREKAVNERLHAFLSATGQRVPQLTVGDTVSLSTRSELKALEALSRAVENVETLSGSGNDMYEVHGRLMKHQRFNDEQRRLEQRAFETLLRDSMDAPSDDAWTEKLRGRARRQPQA